jgi:hypothetical protein
MECLVKWYQETRDGMPPEVLAAWLHHRFTQIHPFQDGNGRIARALATLVFLKAEMFPLVIRSADREQYINALETADAGDLSKLVQFFAKRQQEAIRAAMGIEEQVQHGQYAEEIISAAIPVLKNRSADRVEHVKKVRALADQLWTVAFARLTDIAKGLDKQLQEVSPSYSLPHDYSAHVSEICNYFRENGRNDLVECGISIETGQLTHEIIAHGKLYRHTRFLELLVTTEENFALTISFGSDSYGNNGMMAASALTRHYGLHYPDPNQSESERLFVAYEGTADMFGYPHNETMKTFQFNYADLPESADKRFKNWLEEVIVIALSEWKGRLQA